MAGFIYTLKGCSPMLGSSMTLYGYHLMQTGRTRCDFSLATAIAPRLSYVPFVLFLSSYMYGRFQYLGFAVCDLLLAWLTALSFADERRGQFVDVHAAD